MPFVADLRTVLRGRDFRRLFSVRIVSQAGDGAFQAALASLVFFSPERAATPRATAGILAITVLPYTVVGPLAGVLLDRWQRRQVLVAVNAVRTAMVLAVAALVGAHQVGPLLYVTVLACLAVNRFFLTALGAGLPHVVPRHELVMANAVSPTSGTLAALAGGGAALALRTRLAPGDGSDAVLLVVAAGGYLTASLLALRMAPALLGPDRHDAAERTTVGWAAVVRGARHVRERRPAAFALGVIGVHRLGYGVTVIATIVLSRNYFNDPADPQAGLELLATTFVAAGIGFGVAALVTPLATARWGIGGWVVRCLLGAAAVQAALAAVLVVPVALAAALLLGVAAQGVKICVDAVVQREVDDAFRGRVFAFYDVVFNAAFVVAATVAALTVPADGFSPLLFAVVAALYLAAGVGYRRTLRPAAPSVQTGGR